MTTDPVGVSVYQGGKYYFLRFHLSGDHLRRLGDPERLEIRGQAANGFIIAPNDKYGLKPSKGMLRGGAAYLQSSLNNFELSQKPRKRIDVQPEFENGDAIRIPPLPPSWCKATGEFDTDDERPTPQVRQTPPLLPLPPAVLNGGSQTAPPPKPVPDYNVPVDGTMNELQAKLAGQLNEARTIIKTMEERTGMKFVLDRNLRLVVAL